MKDSVFHSPDKGYTFNKSCSTVAAFGPLLGLRLYTNGRTKLISVVLVTKEKAIQPCSLMWNTHPLPSDFYVLSQQLYCMVIHLVFPSNLNRISNLAISSMAAWWTTYKKRKWDRSCFLILPQKVYGGKTNLHICVRHRHNDLTCTCCINKQNDRSYFWRRGS